MKVKIVDDGITIGEFNFITWVLSICLFSAIVCGVGYLVSSPPGLSERFGDIGLYFVGAFFLIAMLGHTIIRVIRRIFGR